MKFLTQRQLDHFNRDGYLVIDGFLTSAEVVCVKEDIGRVCRERAGMTKDADGFNLEKSGGFALDTSLPAVRAGLFRKIQGAVFHVPMVKEVFTSRKMLDCMEDLMGPSIHYHSSKVMFKPAREGSAKPWHQDAAYWRNYEPNQITVWIAIDDATVENGCVWAIPGSHKLGLIPHIKQELQVEESRIDLTKAVPVPVKPGGLLIFHSLVLHMSHKNTSDKPRCAIICDYDPSPNPSIGGGGTESAAKAVWQLRGVKAVTV
jgi:ectoine hydroxylase-related dioxygenase (phytanoyl-CoA dioxygenase family)